MMTNTTPHRIALIGPGGSRKTTLATALSERLGLPLIDETFRTARRLVARSNAESERPRHSGGASVISAGVGTPGTGGRMMQTIDCKFYVVQFRKDLPLVRILLLQMAAAMRAHILHDAEYRSIPDDDWDEKTHAYTIRADTPLACGMIDFFRERIGQEVTSCEPSS